MKPWEPLPSAALRYGNDCRRCGRLLTSQDRLGRCSFCRSRMRRLLDEHAVPSGPWWHHHLELEEAA